MNHHYPYLVNSFTHERTHTTVRIPSDEEHCLTLVVNAKTKDMHSMVISPRVAVRLVLTQGFAFDPDASNALEQPTP